MKRREFFEKGGCGLLGAAIAYFGMTSCSKKEEPPVEEPAQTPAETPAPAEEMSRKDMIKKMMVEKMGKTEEEADAMLAELEEKLPMVREKCICATCPSYIPEESENAFCHPLIGKSEFITEKKGCDCPNCPIYKMMEMKNGYYCINGSEMEIEAAKNL